MKVKDIMTEDVKFMKADETVAKAANIMLDNNIGGLPVLDDKRNVIGMITESDFIGRKVNIPHAMVSLTQLLGQVQYNVDLIDVFSKAKEISVTNVMSKKVLTISPEASLSDASRLLVDNEISRVPVVQAGSLVGIVTKRDILSCFRAVQTETQQGLCQA